MPVIDLTTQITALAEEVVGQTDLYLVEVIVRGRKGSRVVEVYVDGDEGIGVDDLANISRDLGFLLETEDLVKGKYNLNVSSPGEGRNLKLPRQYRRHVDKPVDIWYFEEGASATSYVSGVNRGVQGDVLQLETDNGEQLDIPLERIETAKIKLPW